MSGTIRSRCVGLLVGPILVVSVAAAAQTGQSRNQGAGPREESLSGQQPLGHRQPRASDLPTPAEKTAADRERERKDRELDRRLRICRNC